MIEYQVSTSGYPVKPSKTDFTRMRWERRDTDVTALADLLSHGHTYRCNLASLKNSGKKDFISSQVVFLDVENKGEEPPVLDDFVKRTAIRPTFYYETFSSIGGSRYRLGYLIDSPVRDRAEFRAITRAIIDRTGILTEKMVDPKSYDPVQNMCGTDKPVTVTYLKYKKDDLDRLAADFIESDVERRTGYRPSHRLTYEEYDIMCDFLAPEGTFESYIRDTPSRYPFVFESAPNDSDDTFLYYRDYKTLVRKLHNGSYYHESGALHLPNTFHDGENRRKKIKVNCSLLHQIYPDCTLTELLVLTSKMFITLFSNDREDRIGREFIWTVVINEMRDPLKASSPYTIKKRFRLPEFRDGKRIHHNTRLKNHYKDLALALFDFSLPIEDNLKEINRMMSEGTKDDFRFTEPTLKRYLDEEGLNYLSVKDKPIKTLKRMIRTKQPKEQCLAYLIENRDKIGKRQFYEYKKRLS